MQQLAAWLGTLIGYSVGYTLKIAGPELRAFLAGAIHDALSDTATVGTGAGPLDAHFLHSKDEAQRDSERIDGASGEEGRKTVGGIPQ